MNEFRHVPRGTKKAAKKTPVEPGLFWRKRKLEIQIRYRQCVGFDEVSARFYRIAHQRIENLIGRDRIFDGHLKHPAYRRIHGGFPELKIGRASRRERARILGDAGAVTEARSSQRHWEGG